MPSTDPPASSSVPPELVLARWRRAAESARDGLWEVQVPGHAVWFSDRFGAILGHPPGGLVPDLAAFVSRIHPQDLPLWRHAWQAAEAQAAPLLLQLRVQDQAGQWRWVSMRGRCWAGPDGRTTTVAGAMTDIHDDRLSLMSLERQVHERTASLARAVAEAERGREDANHARQAQSRFLAHMSHELRTPLSGLLGLVDLARRVSTDPAHQRYLEVAHQSGQALRRTIEQVLDLTRLRDGEMPLAQEPFDLAETLAEVLRGVMPLVRARGLSVRFDWLGDATWVQGDEPRVRQLAGILIGNAAKFTELGHIAVNASVERDAADAARLAIQVDVEDTGPGLPPEHAASVFEDFVQGDNSLSRAHGGTGLGLGIARELARRMGGDVQLRSQPGVGSVFTVTLRLVAAPDPHPVPASPPGHAWLVYRQPAIGVWLQRRLLRMGWTAELLDSVGSAADRAAALPAGQAPRLVVVAEHALVAPEDLVRLRDALPQAHITLLIRPDWNQPALEQQARALAMAFDVMPLTPRDLRLMTSRPPAPAEVPAALPIQLREPQPGHVLVVEDNAVNRMIAEEFLRTLGIRTRTAEDGAKALEACADEPPRLVLMDLQMPVMDGLAATRALRERQQRGELPDFPIVALTAHAMNTDAEACRAAGMVGYLTKPLLLDALRAELQRWWPELATP